MVRRFLFFGIGVLISVIFLSMGPENRLKKTFYDYIDYFDMDKRVIYHLHNDSTTFSTKAECQLVYYSLSKEDLLEVLEGGEVNFDLSEKDSEPCKYYVVENKINGMDFLVTFEFCNKEDAVKVIGFSSSMEDEVCNF
ncbi:MAG: hypothetical protein QGG97_04895 [Flavobacteriales bacterium]|jgi:hypothetical protein|nr:hypothetical protein [Flavobacteriales bacterium]MDP7430870.1 hypothetical protein [Flavobacteriales bacterium]HJN64155.1 hypothetical protein [Flavobacteriales bacterium]|tara:strand:+ start:4994 stop:5407 length:414 start_codon:yes stop_codon:yes gene_type:complete